MKPGFADKDKAEKRNYADGKSRKTALVALLRKYINVTNPSSVAPIVAMPK